MNRKQAEGLARHIETDDPGCTVTGYRKQNGAVHIEVVDTRTGYPFVISSEGDWSGRVEDSAEMIAWLDAVK